MTSGDYQHPDDTYPDMRPDDDLAVQLRALAAWMDGRLDDELADRQYALERAHDYLTWLAYRAEQVSQQHRIRLVPHDAAEPNAPMSGPGGVPVPSFPRR
ncbi:hypothetical protein [Catellatospora sp. NPDC049609]|uniref:hypothetical protein n=1 Tax=Catellatospora sp. NPDC049609 TaxID=3155505 RepID=UPI0034375AE6